MTTEHDGPSDRPIEWPIPIDLWRAITAEITRREEERREFEGGGESYRKELAHRLGVTPATISHITTRKSKRSSTLPALCRELNINLFDFMPGLDSQLLELSRVLLTLRSAGGTDAEIDAFIERTRMGAVRLAEEWIRQRDSDLPVHIPGPHRDGNSK